MNIVLVPIGILQSIHSNLVHKPFLSYITYVELIYFFNNDKYLQRKYAINIKESIFEKVETLIHATKM